MMRMKIEFHVVDAPSEEMHAENDGDEEWI